MHVHDHLTMSTFSSVGSDDLEIENLELLGSIVSYSGLSLDRKRILLHASRVTLISFLAGILIIYWERFATESGIAYSFMLFVSLLYSNASYATTMTIINTIEVVLAMATAMFLSFISYNILGNSHSDPHNPYYGTIIIFVFSLVLTSADRTNKHIMFNKISLAYFAFVGLSSPPTSPNILHQKILWFAVFGAVFSAILSLLVHLLIPTFPSDLILPKIMETIVAERNFYSTISKYLRTTNDAYNLEVEQTNFDTQSHGVWIEGKRRMKEMEKNLKNNIMALNTLFQLSAIESWEKERITKYGEIRDKLVRSYFTLLSLHRLVTRHDFLPAYPIALLHPAHVEILTYMDELIAKGTTTQRWVHFLIHPTGEWPKNDKVEIAIDNVHRIHKKLAVEYTKVRNIPPTKPVLHNSSLMISIQGLILCLSEVVILLEEIRPTDKWHYFLITPKAYYHCFIYTMTNFYKDHGYGIFYEFNQKKSLKEKTKSFLSNLKWRFPLCYSICIATTLPWMLYFFTNHGDRLSITYNNRAWIIVSPIMTIIPTMGGTFSRGFHRILGTVVGASIGYVIGWGILAVGGPDDVSRWIVMQILFAILSFICVIIQQIPGTGYAAFLVPLTAFVAILPFVHSTTLDQIPVINLTTRLVIVSAATLWAMTSFVVLFPRKSVDNLEKSIVDSLCTTGQAFATIMNKGLVYNEETHSCNLDEETRTDLTNTLNVLVTAYQSAPILIQDARFEAWVYRKRIYGYKDLVRQSREVYIALSSVLVSYGPGYTDIPTLNIALSLRPSLMAAIFPVENKVTEMIALRGASMREKRSINAILKSTKERIAIIDRNEWNTTVNEQLPIRYKKILDELTEARKQYWKNRDRIIAQNKMPIEYLHFCAFLNKAERFVNEWDKLRKLVLQEKFKRQLGIDALGNKDDILLQNLPPVELEAKEELAETYSIQNQNQDNILSEENKGGYFA